MKKLFESTVVGGLALRNRFIRSATFEYVYDNESETFALHMAVKNNKTRKRYTRLAERLRPPC